EALKLRPNDFSANYWRGFSSFRAGRFEEASRSLDKAVQLQPDDFNANYWRGLSLARIGHFGEGVASFEKANAIKGGDKATRHLLFYSYLITGQYQKAFRIFPLFVGVAGGTLTFLYAIGLLVLLRFSLKVRPAPAPGLFFSL